MVIYLYITLILLICSLVLMNIHRLRLHNKVRRHGKLPQKGKSTMFDVRHLLMEGEKDLAIQLYCEIFHVTILKARKDIDELQRSLKV